MKPLSRLTGCSWNSFPRSAAQTRRGPLEPLPQNPIAWEPGRQVELGFAGLWTTCDPENTASRRTLELVGAEFVETVDVSSDCIIFQSGHLRKCRYRLDLNKFRGTTDR